MRLASIPLLLLISACGQSDEASQAVNTSGNAATPLGVELQTFAGTGKDRLCIGGTAAAAAVITYAADGLNNCSASGRVEEQGGKLFFVPQEDSSCRVEIRREGETRLTLGAPTTGCAFYCAPGASFEGKTFSRMDKPEPVTDLAGDPLC
ncbi:hypothetical protein GGQ97_001832 [Sphingomonas kaistensis]|uniref:Lipoprotein n=1 Tax=Sphingomonas kaistensis TaxID=298708 RepID=A0A7X6BG35_9SPHN|nr:hypothetical protein [Sphingomonas kaistensis]NJC06039.1 hypothetical protein [Sphingomonas kaistensis]